MNWAEHDSKWSKCTACELHTMRRKVVLGMGRIQHGEAPGATFFIVGQYPGKDEDIIGLPMQGAGGRWVEWAMKILGVPYSECFFTNVLACIPGRAPGVKCVAACRPRVDECLQMVNPKVIISMGLVAAKFFKEDNQIKMVSVAGTQGTYRGYPVLFVTHPFEPARQKTIAGKQESERRVKEDFKDAKAKCIEMGLIERIME